MIEDNEIRGNKYGVQYSSTVAPDFGGGEAGSAGGNIICCNSFNDLYWFAPDPPFGTVVPMAGNSWDHVPPSTGYAGGHDVGLPGAVTVDLDGASVAEDNCPQSGTGAIEIGQTPLWLATMVGWLTFLP